MWEENQYCWVVICKNKWFHLRQNIFYGHKIPLGEADIHESLPDLENNFKVRCDSCHKEYFYEPADVMKSDQELPESFSPHVLFRSADVIPSNEMKVYGAVTQAGTVERRRGRRQLRKVEVLVRGESQEKGAFQEETFTISVSSYGALVVMNTNVAQGQEVVLRNLLNQDEIRCRITRLLPTDRKLAQVSVEFMQPAPKFWLPEPSGDTYFGPRQSLS